LPTTTIEDSACRKCTAGTTHNLRNIPLRTRKLSRACSTTKAPASNLNAREASGGGTGNQPARHFIKFSAQATRQVVPGRGYRILDLKPGTFE
jgi:hypothetical protein